MLNCSTSVTGKGVAGFARTLDGGIVSNCVSTSEGTAGALFATYNAGQLVNTYWGAFLTNKMDAPASALVNAYAVDPADMATDAFADLINANCGANGSSWGIDKNGTPVFGSGNSYQAPEDTTPDDTYTVSFTANDGTSQAVADHMLEVSPDAVNAYRKLGVFALKGVPATSTVTWGTDDANRGNIGINESTGELYIYDNATGTVTATEHKANGSEQTVATIKIKAKAKQFDDFELWYRASDGTVSDVTDGAATVQALRCATSRCACITSTPIRTSTCPFRSAASTLPRAILRPSTATTTRPAFTSSMPAVPRSPLPRATSHLRALAPRA